MTAARCPFCDQTLPDDLALAFDEPTGTLVVDGRVMRLQGHERRVFATLWRARPRLAPDETIIADCWLEGVDDEPEDPIRSVRIVIAKLRRRLAGTRLAIERAWAQGYRLVVQTKA